jgi:hypothetical protein
MPRFTTTQPSQPPDVAYDWGDTEDLAQAAAGTPEELRTALKVEILKNTMEDFEDFMALNRLIIANIFDGTITPAQAEAARSYVEYLFAGLLAHLTKAQNDGELDRDSLTVQVQMARQRAKRLESESEGAGYSRLLPNGYTP